MKKELFLAIIIGAFLGLTVMILAEAKRTGKIVFPFAKEGSFKQEVTPTGNPQDVSSVNNVKNNEGPLSLKIVEPEDESISTEEKVSIKGKASPLATIVVIWENGEDILVADQNGNFTTTVNLNAGPNEIEISAYTDNGQVDKKILTVIYSTAKF